MATLVTFRIAGWPAEAALDELGRAGLRDRADDPEPRCAPDQRRLLQRRGGDRTLRRGGRAARRAHAGDAPAAAPAGDPGRPMTDRRDPAALPPRRSWARGPLAPVPARAAPGRARGRLEPERRDRPGAGLPGLRRRAEPRRRPPRRRPADAGGRGLCRPRPRRRQPRAPTWSCRSRPGSGSVVRRSAWSAALGFFAAVPIAYLVLVVAVQIVRPLLG